jgi:hypothetical protein
MASGRFIGQEIMETLLINAPSAAALPARLRLFSA